MTTTTSPEQIAEYFEASAITEPARDRKPSYNVAPSQQIFVVSQKDQLRKLSTMQWGLVPFFSKDASGAARMINARAEAVPEKPAYRRAFLERRCLIPADGFYEWKAQEHSKSKEPWYFTARNEELLAFAGLWEIWHDPEQSPNADPLATCTIITTEANRDLSKIHHRMPLTLHADDWATWLDPDNKKIAELRSLLAPPPEGCLRGVRVSTQVNNVKNDTSELIEPAASETLFDS